MYIGIIKNIESDINPVVDMAGTDAVLLSWRSPVRIPLPPASLETVVEDSGR